MDCSNACHKLFVKHAIRFRVGEHFNMGNKYNHCGKWWKSFSRCVIVCVCVAYGAINVPTKPLALGLLRHLIIWSPYFVKFCSHHECHEINKCEWMRMTSHLSSKNVQSFSLSFAICRKVKQNHDSVHWVAVIKLMKMLLKSWQTLLNIFFHKMGDYGRSFCGKAKEI